MVLSRTLTWLCEPPQNNVITLSGLLRRGWPGFANMVLFAKAARPWPRRAAGRAHDFLGAMGGFIYYGGLPLGSLGKVSGLTNGLELAAIVKVIAILAGWAVQFSLKIIAYLFGGFVRFGAKPESSVRRSRMRPSFTLNFWVSEFLYRFCTETLLLRLLTTSATL